MSLFSEFCMFAVVSAGVLAIVAAVFWESPDILPTVPEHPIIVIDGCEYFKVPSTPGSYTLTHKGNCKNHVQQ